MKLSNNKILITGGATGIGLGLTERFLLENNTVIVCGRRAAVVTPMNNITYSRSQRELLAGKSSF